MYYSILLTARYTTKIMNSHYYFKSMFQVFTNLKIRRNEFEESEGYSNAESKLTMSFFNFHVSFIFSNTTIDISSSITFFFPIFLSAYDEIARLNLKYLFLIILLAYGNIRRYVVNIEVTRYEPLSSAP